MSTSHWVLLESEYILHKPSINIFYFTNTALALLKGSPLPTLSKSGAMSHTQNTKHPLISADHISLLRSGLKVIDDVSLVLNTNEITTLIGPNGAGKTTLIRILLGLQKIDSGTVWTRKNLKIGYMPQSFEVNRAIPLTVFRFLTLALGNSRKNIQPFLDEVGGGHLVKKQIQNLSGGEFQRVCLARALINDPDLLILDEPVQGVDYSGEAALYRLIADIRRTRGCGILMVSHDLHIVLGESDKVICLDRHICCSGVPEMVAQNKEYERLFGKEAAQAYAVYNHNHDHEHDLSGNICSHEDNISQ